MKKGILALTCALLLCVVTGCNNEKQLKCSKMVTESGKTLTAELVADLNKDNKIIKALLTYKFGDKETAETFCKLLQEAQKTVSCSGKSVTFENIENLEDQNADASSRIIGKTKDALKAEAEENGFSCK